MTEKREKGFTGEDAQELKPRIKVIGAGGAGGNAVNNMIQTGLEGCEFVVTNTDAQALASSQANHIVQMGIVATEGLGAGSRPEVGRAAAEEAIDEIKAHLTGAHMVFITAGMGGGTGTGAAPVIAQAARELGVLTVGVVTKPFQFEGRRRMQIAEAGIKELQQCVDTLIVIPNQNLFRIANAKTTFADAFTMADQVLYSGVACVTDLMVKEGLINLDFADVRSIMHDMGKAMMGTGEASGEGRAKLAAEAAIANPLLDETSMHGAKGLLISITGGKDLTLFEVDEAATRIREEVDVDANIILGATFDESLQGLIRVSVVATGIDSALAIEGDVENAVSGIPQNKMGVPRGAFSPHHHAHSADAPERPFLSLVTPQDASTIDLKDVKEAVRLSAQSPHAENGSELSRKENGDASSPAPMGQVQTRISSHMPKLEDFPPFAQNLVSQTRREKSQPVRQANERDRHTHEQERGERQSALSGEDHAQKTRGFFSRFKKAVTNSFRRQGAERVQDSREAHVRNPEEGMEPSFRNYSSATTDRGNTPHSCGHESEGGRADAPSLSQKEEDVLEIPSFLRSRVGS